MKVAAVVILLAVTTFGVGVPPLKAETQSDIVYKDTKQIVFKMADFEHSAILRLTISEDMETARKHCAEVTGRLPVIHAVSEFLIVYCGRP